MYFMLMTMVLLTAQLASCDEMTKHQLLKKLLNESDYDPSVYPYDGTGNATEVTVQLIITDIYEVNDIKMDFKMTLYLRMKWSDHRLYFEKNGTNITFDRIELAGRNVGEVWMPDLFFDVERDASYRGIMSEEKLIYIYQHGTVAYSERITMTAECDMNLEKFPFDTQNCPLQLESYAYMSKELIVKWTNNIGKAVLFEELKTPHFKVDVNNLISGFHVGNSEDIFDEPGNFSYLKFTLTLTRETESYDFMYFATYPCYFIASLASFGMNERITPLTTVMFAIIIQWIGIYDDLPLTPFFTKLDIWFFVHFLMVGLIMLYNVFLKLWIQVHEDIKSRNDALSKVLSQRIHLPPHKSAGYSKNKWKVESKKQEKAGNCRQCCKERGLCDTEECCKWECSIRCCCCCCCCCCCFPIFRIVIIAVLWILQIVVWALKILFYCSRKVLVWTFRIAGCRLPCTDEECCNCICCKCCNELTCIEYIDKYSERCLEVIVAWILENDEVNQTVYTLDIGKRIKRTFNECYFLQMYLQAKYPDIRIAFDTSSEQLKLQNDTQYIEHLLNSLKSDVWNRYSEIRDIKADFLDNEDWSYTFYRLMTYNLFFVDSTGKKTAPDLLFFLLFVQMYCLFLPIHLSKWGCSSGWFTLILVPLFALIAVIIGKYRCILPPKFDESYFMNNQNTEMPSTSQNVRGFVNTAVNQDETQF